MLTPKNDDGLVAPAGFEIERHADGTPKLVDVRKRPGDGFWIQPYFDSIGPYHVALRKLPERKLLDFRGAIAAHKSCHTILCEGEPRFRWGRAAIIAHIDGVSASYEWLIDRTDFYVEDQP